MRLLTMDTSSIMSSDVSASRFFVDLAMVEYRRSASSSSERDSSKHPAGKRRKAWRVTPPATAAATPVGATT